MYYELGEQEKGNKVSETLVRLITEKLVWLSTFDKEDSNIIFDEIDTSLYMFKNLIEQIDSGSNDKEYVAKVKADFMSTIKRFEYLVPDEEE